MDAPPLLVRAVRSFAGGDAAGRAAALLSTAAVGSSFAPGLLPRGNTDQAMVTGVVAAAEYGAVATTQAVLGGLVRAGLRRASDRLAATLVADAALALGGLTLERGLAQRPAEPLRRATLRTGGRMAAFVGVAGVVVTLVAEAEERLARGRLRPPPGLSAASGLVLGAGLAAWRIRRHRAGADDAAHAPLPRSLPAGLALSAGIQGAAALQTVAARGVGRGIAALVPTARPVAVGLGHAAVTAAVGAGILAGLDVVQGRAETGGAVIEPGHLATLPSPWVSGGPASRVEREQLSREGMRFAALALDPDEIAETTGDRPDRGPVRVFVPLAAAETVDARVALAMEELERLGGFERSVLCVASPTGSGYVNHVAVEALELLTRGDCATVALQYSLRPSFLSLGRVAVGREQNRALLHALAWRLRSVPDERRPRVVVFGESLGAHTLQDAVLHEGAAGLRRAGVDAALFVGTPAGSGWARRWRAEPRLADPERDVIEVADAQEWEALEPAIRSGARYVLLSRHDDPIIRFEPALAVQRPRWLGPPEDRPLGVPAAARWYPLTTFLLTAVDVKNALDVVPGVFVSRGHDYRADLVRMVAGTYRLPAVPAELARVEQALRERERAWARHRLVAEQLHRAREAVSRQVAAWGPLLTPPETRPEQPKEQR